MYNKKLFINIVLKDMFQFAQVSDTNKKTIISTILTPAQLQQNRKL